jgi:hypothetical protein
VYPDLHIDKMKLFRSTLTAVVAATSALMLSSCFTGIESTPRISDKDVSRRHVVTSAEDRYLANVNQQPITEWQPGKQFYVTDSKISLALEPGGPTPEAGEHLRYLNARAVTSLTGEDDTELVFADSTGGEVVYRINATMAELGERRSVAVPFTIEMSMVDSVRSRLVGRDLYVRTSLWYDADGHAVTGLKYVKAKITSVVPGNVVYPVKVSFATDVDGKPVEASVYMSVGDAIHSARNFPALFSFDNPRKNFPLVTDENWSKIMHGRVAVDMTRDECRLALGSPSRIDRYQGTTAYGERWSYENGVYLIFFDGVLSSFRQ